ncbi:MAG: LuxR C-terminal-related transcriptional regulator [Legionella sp.]|nr:LuxR C-terminal-related transcriptional regulator [Legionella sp.]
MNKKIDSTQIALSKSLDINVCNSLIEITEPLKKFNINAFFYSKFYQGKRVNLLSNYPSWLEHLRKFHSYYKTTFNDQFHFRPGFSIDFLGGFDPSQMAVDMAEHNLKNAIYISNVSKDKMFSEVFVFTTDNSEGNGSKHLSNLVDDLSEFCFVFKDKGNGLIKHTQVSLDTIAQAENTKNKKPYTKRYYLGSPYDDYYLTQKEFDYLKEYLSGSSSKNIAKKYAVSFRTVEKRLELLKHKLDCRNKSDLLEKIIYSQLFYPFFLK